MTDDTRSDLQELLPFVLDGARLRTLPADPPLFAATDLCAMTGHTNARKAVRDLLDDDEWTTVDLRDHLSAGGPGVTNPDPRMVMVNESGAWALIVASRVPGARRIRKWLTSEVLPAIRRRGMYATPEVARELTDGLTGMVLTVDAVLAGGRRRAERDLLAGVAVSAQDQDDELAEVRALVDMRRFATVALDRVGPTGEPVEVPAAVVRLLDRAGTRLAAELRTVDPWAVRR